MRIMGDVFVAERASVNGSMAKKVGNFRFRMLNLFIFNVKRKLIVGNAHVKGVCLYNENCCRYFDL